MRRRRRWPWVVGTVLVVVIGGVAALALWRDPLLLPGSHRVEVYAVNDGVSAVNDRPPGWLGRTVGRCDADAWYAKDGGSHLCLVLSGPLGEISATRRAGKVTVATDQIAALRTMAAADAGTPQPTTRLVVMSGGPAALIPVGALSGAPISVSALS